MTYLNFTILQSNNDGTAEEQNSSTCACEATSKEEKQAEHAEEAVEAEESDEDNEFQQGQEMNLWSDSDISDCENEIIPSSVSTPHLLSENWDGLPQLNKF